jgi:hypothetical protein
MCAPMDLVRAWRRQIFGVSLVVALIPASVVAALLVLAIGGGFGRVADLGQVFTGPAVSGPSQTPAASSSAGQIPAAALGRLAASMPLAASGLPFGTAHASALHPSGSGASRRGRRLVSLRRDAGSARSATGRVGAATHHAASRSRAFGSGARSGSGTRAHRGGHRTVHPSPAAPISPPPPASPASSRPAAAPPASKAPAPIGPVMMTQAPPKASAPRPGPRPSPSARAASAAGEPGHGTGAGNGNGNGNGGGDGNGHADGRAFGGTPDGGGGRGGHGDRGRHGD